MIQSIHYVNIDAQSTSAFIEAFSNPQTSQQCSKVGESGDVLRNRAAMNLDPQNALPHRVLVKSSSVPHSAAKSSGGKRRRELKTMDKTAAEFDSAAMTDTSKKQRMSPSDSTDNADDIQAGTAAAADEDCVICMCPMTRPKKLACGHSFCSDCIDESFKKCQPKCPSCGRLFGVMRGNQPPGSMTVQSVPDSLPGFQRCGMLVIMYNIPNGIQDVSHTVKL